MSKEIKNKIVPKLRFPEFRDSGEWKTISLIDVADEKVKWSFTGGPFGSNLKASDYVIKGIRIIQLQNIGDGEFIDDYKIFTSENKANELLSCNIYPDDIILSKMGDPVGRACLIPNTSNRYVMCSDGIRLVVDEQRYSKYFIFTLINSTQFRSRVEKTSTGSTRKRIGLDNLKDLPMVVPCNLKEQQKIASCLSSLDQLITAQSQKLEALKDHKKGLMQQLFPAEGKKVPKLRFAEFRDSQEWEEKKLAEILNELKLGGNYENSEIRTEIPVIKMGNLERGNINTDRLQYLAQNVIYQEADILKKGDLLFNTRNTLDLVGKVAIWKEELPFALYNSNLLRLTFLKKYVESNYFMNYCLNTDVLLKKIRNIATGTTSVAAIYTKDLLKLKISFPSLQEQQKIASCLSSLDDLITAQSEKIEALKEHKKGLMQGLFPSAK